MSSLQLHPRDQLCVVAAILAHEATVEQFALDHWFDFFFEKAVGQRTANRCERLLEDAVELVFPGRMSLAFMVNAQRENCLADFSTVALGGDVPHGQNSRTAIERLHRDAEFRERQVAVLIHECDEQRVIESQEINVGALKRVVSLCRESDFGLAVASPVQREQVCSV